MNIEDKIDIVIELLIDNIKNECKRVQCFSGCCLYYDFCHKTNMPVPEGMDYEEKYNFARRIIYGDLIEDE